MGRSTSTLSLVPLLALLAGLAAAQSECSKRILVARPTVTASSSSYASSSSSTAGSQASGETALVGGLLLKKGNKENAVVKKVQLQIFLPGANRSAYVDATCPQGAADQVNCTYKVQLPYASGNDGPIAYLKGVVMLDDGAMCVSDVLTVDPRAAAEAARKSAEATVAQALADAAAIKNQAIAKANAILALYGLPPIDRSG